MSSLRKIIRKILFESLLTEDINIPIKVGDTVLGGKFKNKKIVVKTIDKNEKGDITINGKPLLRFRIVKENSEIIKEAIGRIAKFKIKGTFYHGTAVQAGDNLISEFNPRYSDWDATWFSTDESISEEFSDHNFRDKSETAIIYKVKLECGPIANISYEQSQRMMESWALDDFREVIPILKQKGFNGWKTPGSIGGTMYDDYAVFNPSCIKSIEAVKLFIKNNWTEYMSISDAEDILAKLHA